MPLTSAPHLAKEGALAELEREAAWKAGGFGWVGVSDKQVGFHNTWCPEKWLVLTGTCGHLNVL